MSSISARLAAVAGAAAPVAMVALPASAATAAPSAGTASRSVSHIARPDSGSDCNPTPLAAVSECTTVLGAGLKISQITGIAISNVDYDITQVHIEIYGPHGAIHNCPNITLGAYSTAGCTWKNPSPNATMTAGDYCSESWEHISGNYYAKLSAECIDVHS